MSSAYADGIQFIHACDSVVISLCREREAVRAHCTDLPIVQLVSVNVAVVVDGRVPLDEDGERRGGPGRRVPGRAGHVHLGLGDQLQRGAGGPGAVLVVGQDPDGVPGAGEEALQGHLLQGSAG